MVVKAIAALGTAQGLTTLKIMSKNQLPLFPADWFAGVDYDDDFKDEDDNEYMPTETDIADNDHAELEVTHDRVDKDELNNILNDNTTNPIDKENAENAENTK